jgi:2-oxo-4-hydroxy-4-carboxy-5-ureidoimidazoline decarboxylase
MNQSLRAISEINSLTEEDFVRIVGPVFEHSPWIAKAAAASRPFLNLDSLEKTLREIVLNSGETKQIELIRAHPDLVGRAALQGNLTNESTREQAAAGLGNLDVEEIRLFQKLNAAYREKFGFPFVICARLNKKEAILRGFDSRLQNSREDEIQTALGEIFKIAQLRLRDLVEARG